VNKIALGTVKFGTNYGIGLETNQVRPEEVGNILRYANLMNVDLLDTAPSYGDSEKVLGDLGVQQFDIITKTRHFGNIEISDSDIRLLKQDFYHSLKNLNQDNIYGILVHNTDDLLKPGGYKIFTQLEEFKQEGKIKKFGVSIYTYEQLEFVLENFDIDLVQLPFNIFDIRLVRTKMLSRLQRRNIEVHARSVFLQGLLLMNNKNRPDKFNRWSALWRAWQEWLNDNNITALEATIRYAISVPEISKVLVGVDTSSQLKEIIDASDGFLPDLPIELFTEDSDLLNPSNWSRL